MKEVGRGSITYLCHQAVMQALLCIGLKGMGAGEITGTRYFSSLRFGYEYRSAMSRRARP